MGLGADANENQFSEVVEPQLIDISATDEKIVDISNSGQMQALTADGELYMWGFNLAGQVGSGNFDKYIEMPTKVNLDSNTSNKVVSADTNFGISYVITELGELYAWGANGQYSLGNNSTSNSNKPVLIDLDKESEEDKVAEAFVAFEKSYAITENGDYYSWGINDEGQVGNGTNGEDKEVSEPIKIDVVPGQDDNIKPIKTNYEEYNASFAITQQGEVYSWGNNDSGKLGLGKDGNPIKKPEKVNLSGEKVIYADFASHSFILTDQGNLYFFGDNSNGQLGNGDSGDDAYQSSPVLIVDNIFTPETSGLSGGAIAGIVIGSITGAVLIGAGSWYFIKKRKAA